MSMHTGAEIDPAAGWDARCEVKNGASVQAIVRL